MRKQESSNTVYKRQKKRKITLEVTLTEERIIQSPTKPGSKEKSWNDLPRIERTGQNEMNQNNININFNTTPNRL